MHDVCGDKTYSTAYIKHKLEELFGESLIIRKINGKRNVVTLKDTAAILHDFYSRNTSDNAENGKIEELLQIASNVNKSNIRSIRGSLNFYPCPLIFRTW